MRWPTNTGPPSSRPFPWARCSSGRPTAPTIGWETTPYPRSGLEKKEDRWVEQLHRISPRDLEGQPEDATYGVLLETLEASRQGRVCRPELLPLSQRRMAALPAGGHPAPAGRHRRIRHPYGAVAWRHPVLDTEIANLREGLRLGYTQPRGNAQAVLEQLNDLLKLPAERSPFRRSRRTGLGAGLRDSVVGIVAPEILRPPDATGTSSFPEYIPRGRRVSTELAALPNGADCYGRGPSAHTTVDRDARSIQQLGLQQMAAIKPRLGPLPSGASEPRICPRSYERLRTRPGSPSAAGRRSSRPAEAAVARGKAAMPKWVGRLPRGDIIVDPCLPFEEKSGCPNSYVSCGTPDGKRPGRWRINAGNVPASAPGRAGGRRVHETIPGHHLPIAIAQEREEADPITRYLFFSGYTQGCALYAERLAQEMDCIERPLPVRRFRGRPWRGPAGGGSGARGAGVVAAGDRRHGRPTFPSRTRRWNRNGSLHRRSGPGHGLHDRAAGDRAAPERGQVPAGESFDIREFHDRVLESGSVPLSFLKAHVEGGWTAGARR